MHVATSIASSPARVDRWAFERAKRRSRAFSAPRSPDRADLKGRHRVPPRATPQGGPGIRRAQSRSSARPERTKPISTTTQGRNGDSEFGQARRPGVLRTFASTFREIEPSGSGSNDPLGRPLGAARPEGGAGRPISPANTDSCSHSAPVDHGQAPSSTRSVSPERLRDLA
jgi:hypothetical protein